MAKKSISRPSRAFKLSIQMDVDLPFRLVTKMVYFLHSNMDLEGL